MYMNLHIIVNSKNKAETKNWGSDSSQQWNGNKLLATSVAPGNFPLERPIYFPTGFSENVLGANLIYATKYSSKKSHLRRNKFKKFSNQSPPIRPIRIHLIFIDTEWVKTYLFRRAFSSFSDLNLLSVFPILNFMYKILSHRYLCYE